MEKVSEEYEKFLNWCEDKWVLNYKWKKLLSKLSNSDKKFLKDQYEIRLKTDMVTILTELQMDIEETVKEEELIDKKWANGLHYSEKIIQQKIDKMREG